MISIIRVDYFDIILEIKNMIFMKLRFIILMLISFFIYMLISLIKHYFNSMKKKNMLYILYNFLLLYLS